MSKLSVNYSYAVTVWYKWVWWYIKAGKYLAALRTIYFTLIRGHIGEACQECGMPYHLWHAYDSLYERVTVHGRYKNGEAAPGLLCHDCFHEMAESKGITLQWNPSDVKELGMWDEVVCTKNIKTLLS